MEDDESTKLIKHFPPQPIIHEIPRIANAMHKNTIQTRLLQSVELQLENWRRQKTNEQRNRSIRISRIQSIRMIGSDVVSTYICDVQRGKTGFAFNRPMSNELC